MVINLLSNLVDQLNLFIPKYACKFVLNFGSHSILHIYSCDNLGREGKGRESDDGLG